MNEFVIERSRPEDAAAMLEYLKIIGGETDNLSMGAEGIPITPEKEEAYIRSIVGSTDNAMFTARIGDEIVGIGNIDRYSRRMRHRGSIGISVRRSAWHRGVGTALMETLIAFARENDFEQLELEVRCDNDRAIRLYERFGFRRICVLPAFLKVNGEDHDCLFMVLRLKDRN